MRYIEVGIDFRQPARGDPRAPPYAFYVERLFDAVKLVGTANGSGLFGVVVAIYYFSARSPEITTLLKSIAFIYFVGIFCFALAYNSLALFFINQEPSLSGDPDHVPASRWYIAGILLAYSSFTAWGIGSGIAAFALYLL